MNTVKFAFFVSMFVAGSFCINSSAAEYQAGDIVRLVERDQDIPAHSGPGVSAVHLRLASGSQATVLARDATTGWYNVRGTSREGSVATGWITSTYIRELIERPTSSAWNPPKGSPNPRPGRLRIATWNIETLHALDNESVYTGSDPSVARTAADYIRIRNYIRLFDPDILAVQEVDGEEALNRVVDTDVYDVHVSSRPRGTLNGRQNTGFAYKRGLTVAERPDFEALDVNNNGRLRYGTWIDVTFNGHTIKLMSVHLKSGCFENSSTSSACTTLDAQVQVLESWIDAAALDSEPFIILGDFNRRLNLPSDTVWNELDDGEPANADLLAITRDMPICCRDNRFTTFIDHIVLDRRAAQWVDPTSFRHVTYRQQDRDHWDLISDHCPVVVELWIPSGS